jgi:DNA-binding XRE family transcriptional regulator
MYSRDGIQTGRFFYVRKNKLENLYLDYKQKKRRSYKRFKSFGGAFPLVEHNLGKMGITIEGTPNCDLAMYEKLKDKAVESIGKKDVVIDKEKQKLNDLKKMIGKLKFPIKSQEDMAERLGLSDRTLYNWGKLDGQVDSEVETGNII